MDLHDIFSERLKRISKMRGYKTEGALFKALDQCFNLEGEEQIIFQNTVHTWWSNKAIPTMDKMVLLCNFLDCDIDYLLGRHDETSFDRHYIAEQTGLSEAVIIRLQESQNIEGVHLGLIPAHKKKMCDLGSLVSYFLSHNETISILNLLYIYFSSDITIKVRNRHLTDKMTFSSIYSDDEFSFFEVKPETVLFSEIQRLIISYKEKIENRNI